MIAHTFKKVTIPIAYQDLKFWQWKYTHYFKFINENPLPLFSRETPENLKIEDAAFRKNYLNQRAERRAEPVQTLWPAFKDYRQAMEGLGKDLKLVFGCGHYHDSHGPDEHSHNIKYTHADAFTITNDFLNYKECKINPGINGFFPQDIEANVLPNIFNEIFLEEVDGGTQQYYGAIFNLLQPGGLLIDDRYDDDPFLTIKNLRAAGFTHIIFNDHYNDPRNGRKNRRMVMAYKY